MQIMAKSATTEEKAVAPTGCIAFQWNATDQAAEKNETTRMNLERRSWFEIKRKRTAGMIKAKIQTPTGGQLNPNNRPLKTQPTRRNPGNLSITPRYLLTRLGYLLIGYLLITPEYPLIKNVKLNDQEFDCTQG